MKYLLIILGCGFPIGILGLFFLDNLNKPIRAILVIISFLGFLAASKLLIDWLGIYYAILCAFVPFIPLLIKKKKDVR